MGDATRLTQVVRNLLTNASKFTPDEGRIHLSLQAQQAQVVLRVKDTGVGLAAHQLEAIFERFVQVVPALKRPSSGLGLGLALVKQLVELHQGQVGVHSPGLDQGCEFTITLPQLVKPAVRAEPVHGAASAIKPRLLLVDDNADLARVTALFLLAKGYEIQTCLGGAEAIGLLAHWRPEVVLLDLDLPELDGYETARQLRQLAWGRHGVVIALSGYGQAEDRARTRAAGFDGHLLKPLKEEELRRLLERLFKPRGAVAPPPILLADPLKRQQAHDLRSNLSLIEFAMSQFHPKLVESDRHELLRILDRNMQGLTQKVSVLLAKGT